MPSPLDLLLDPTSLAVFFLYGMLMLWEGLKPARSLPAVRHWRLIGLAAFSAYFLISSYLPLFWADWLSAFQICDLSGLGRLWGAVVGLIAYEAGVYLWHRSMHGSDVLWRTFHQMHHSAERIDTYSAFWFSPFDVIGWTVLFSLPMTLLGLPPEAVTIVLLITSFLSIFQHSNISTPRWLGYFIQRPESHSYHHARGIHQKNYADLPIFDILFGTFHNPPDFAEATGFYTGASTRLADMLLFRDVSRPR